jgi:hypothetical protein
MRSKPGDFGEARLLPLRPLGLAGRGRREGAAVGCQGGESGGGVFSRSRTAESRDGRTATSVDECATIASQKGAEDMAYVQ